MNGNVNSNPVPSQNVQQSANVEYVGFWPRAGAALLDNLAMGLIVLIWTTDIGSDTYYTTCWFVSFIYAMGFWMTRQTTPGKMVVRAKVVDARTLGKPSTGQFFIRWLGYLLSMLPLCLGFIWVAFDEKKRGWHDMLAGTLIVRDEHASQ
ncbi:MAG: RDD family protein [Azoarcus sp.]|jgi:uncharacterized RDD family membrane protein YckC|nr:RDD family protein [Azoarcus sp.]